MNYLQKYERFLEFRETECKTCKHINAMYRCAIINNIKWLASEPVDDKKYTKIYHEGICIEKEEIT